jgi:anti-sigma B factor antagonist
MIDVELDEQDGASVLRPSGRLTLISAPKFRDVLREAIDGGRRQIVVDLHDTSFMDSAGLGALVAGLKMARQAGGDLRIARPTAQVSTVLRLTNLDRVLRPYGSVGDATRDW